MSAAISAIVPEPSKHCQTTAPLSFSAHVCTYWVPAAIRPSTISLSISTDATSGRATGVKPSSISSAVNADYARMDHVLSDGDEVAFLPPVSGG